MTTLVTHRLAKGLTQGQLASRMGVHLSTVSAWETGRAVPQPSRLPELARMLGIDPLKLARLMVPQDPAPTTAP